MSDKPTGGRVNTYPKVLGEFETLALLLDGRSIARYGDGEFKMASNPASEIKSQQAHPRLSARLRRILSESGDCLVGIPNMGRLHDMTHEKAGFWRKHQHFCSLLSEDKSYVSSLITRPDSAPWINTDEYWAMVESLWRGQDVTLVRGSSKSFTAERLMLAGARSVTEILTKNIVSGKPQHAFAEYDDLIKRIGRPKRAIICLGPTATVLAVDLCAKGVHAIDLGHGGMFHKKRLNNEPMWVTDKDKVAV